MQYYKEDSKTILNHLGSSSKGLSNAKAHAKIQKLGENKLQTENKISPLKIFFNQFKSFIIYLLFIAVVLSALIGQIVNAVLILIILILNALLGFVQEYNTQKSLQALKRLNKVKAHVYRDEQLKKINSIDLVPGDIILVEAGDIIPADCRIIEVKKLEVEESSLTGESKPVEKKTQKLSKESEIGDQTNMLFSSTIVTKGSGTAVVVSTGMNTEIGKITAMVRDVKEEQTPLQKRLEQFGKKLSYAILGICIIIFSMLLYTNDFTIENISTFALIALSLAVAAVPTVLPSVVTVTLSVGVKRLLKKKALVRNLASVETLGSCDVICTDKTGTLTKNEMTVKKAWTVDDKETTIEGIGYNPHGHIEQPLNPLLFKIGKYCNNSSIFKKKGLWTLSGEPTEAALIVSAKKAKIKETSQVLDEIPFDSSRKMMSVLVKENNQQFLYAKGAPDVILQHSTHALINGKKVPLTKNIKNKILEKNSNYSKQSLRVLGFAYKEVSTKNQFRETHLVFVGLQAMEDPPRPEVFDALEKSKKAGIRVVMITGDYKETAQAIGNTIGIEGEVIEGKELRNLSDKELEKKLNSNTNIFARAIPEDKQRLVTILQKQKHIVAMTGDGVNDAPALKKANIGVAVGSGTDVAKEASDFVLLNDSFANIVEAIEEGRGIYDNIQKSIMLLLSGNFSEILVIFFAILLGWNLPLTAVLLLWINLIANGTPGIAFAVDPYDKEIMKRKPLSADLGILPPDKLATISFVGLSGSLLSLIMFYIVGGASASRGDEALFLAQTMVFTFIVLYELFHVFMIRQEYNVDIFSNNWMWGALGSSLLFQTLLIYTPIAEFFSLVALTLPQLGIIGIGLLAFFMLHLIYNSFARKYFRAYYYND